jgi:predicted Zn-dependent protease
MANLDIARGNFAAARQQLREALRQDPHTFAAHERLGMMDLAAGMPRDALREFEIEKRLTGGTPDLMQRLTQAKALARSPAPARPGR